MEIVSSEFVEEPVLMLALSVLLIMIVTRLSIVERMAPVILKFKENALRCTLLIMELLVFRPVFFDEYRNYWRCYDQACPVGGHCECTGQNCTDSHCTKEPMTVESGGACTETFECALIDGYAATCNLNQCIVQKSVANGAACDTTSACPDGSVCSGSVCVRRVGRSCEYDFDCGNRAHCELQCNVNSTSSICVLDAQDEVDYGTCAPKMSVFGQKILECFYTTQGDLIPCLQTEFADAMCCLKCSEALNFDLFGRNVKFSSLAAGLENFDDSIFLNFEEYDFDCGALTATPNVDSCCSSTSYCGEASFAGCTLYVFSGKTLDSRTKLIVSIVVPVGAFIIIASIVLCCCIHRKRKRHSRD